MSTHLSRNHHAATESVYRDEHYCGMIFCPCASGVTDYLASPWTNEIEQRRFSTEAEAIDYLVSAA